MLLNVVFTFGVYVVVTKALLIDTNEKRNQNYKQLSDFIRLLNSQNEKRLETLNDPDFVKDLENEGKIAKYKEAVGNDVIKNLQYILRIVQKNYDAYEKNEELKSKADPGVIFISNPEVLEQYKKGYKRKDSAQTYTNQLRRNRSSFSSPSSSASLSFEDSNGMGRNLKDLLQDIRNNAMLPSADESEESFVIKRRNQKAFLKRESIKDDSIEKAVWKEDTVKLKPKKKKDLTYAFDTNQQASRVKKDFSSRKRPEGFQPGSKMKFDSYQPKKESYFKREEYRTHGRTSIPSVGKKSIYENK